mmetsp:Transcript_27199/g.84439  ORF Transcript_27199/g.84439 Transcript_27199/m.84439 type:complete len:483 (+) Transcript_27199:584-2032(+)
MEESGIVRPLPALVRHVVLCAVQLCDEDVAALVLHAHRKLLVVREESLARLAPGRVDVDQHVLLGAQDDPPEAPAHHLQHARFLLFRLGLRLGELHLEPALQGGGLQSVVVGERLLGRARQPQLERPGTGARQHEEVRGVPPGLGGLPQQHVTPVRGAAPEYRGPPVGGHRACRVVHLRDAASRHQLQPVKDVLPALAARILVRLLPSSQEHQGGVRVHVVLVDRGLSLRAIDLGENHGAEGGLHLASFHCDGLEGGREFLTVAAPWRVEIHEGQRCPMQEALKVARQQLLHEIVALAGVRPLILHLLRRCRNALHAPRQLQGPGSHAGAVHGEQAAGRGRGPSGRGRPVRAPVSLYLAAPRLPGRAVALVAADKEDSRQGGHREVRAEVEVQWDVVLTHINHGDRKRCRLAGLVDPVGEVVEGVNLVHCRGLLLFHGEAGGALQDVEQRRWCCPEPILQVVPHIELPMLRGLPRDLLARPL